AQHRCGTTDQPRLRQTLSRRSRLLNGKTRTRLHGARPHPNIFKRAAISVVVSRQFRTSSAQASPPTRQIAVPQTRRNTILVATRRAAIPPRTNEMLAKAL
ncbi:hypothetical protein, partial [Burkholderia sp.]|uniref:hypothetical protein n=1 Tax=Burkholderia sp. TaxID=36773 RepID=UPI0025835566